MSDMGDKWIWTFGGGTEWAKNYVVINGNEMAGRRYVFEKYGQENMAFDYPYDIGMIKCVERFNLKLLEEVTV